jgi:hypothetical protein
MNLRTTGNTCARLMMGQDEIGLKVRHWLRKHEFPVFTRELPRYDVTIVKSLTGDMLCRNAVTTMTGPESY